MTDKEKLEKAVKLADAMYYAAQYLTTDASRLHKAMEEYHQFVITEYNKKESESEELNDAASSFAREDSKGIRNPANFYYIVADKARIFKAGAQWQREQFEKNRLAHCDAQTEVEAEVESDFVMGIIENEHRQPTFDDAIKYGMRLQKEQMMKDAVTGILDCDDNGSWIELKSNIVSPGEAGDKVKVIIIKE